MAEPSSSPLSRRLARLFNVRPEETPAVMGGLLLFFLLFGFAIKNDQLVTLNFFFGSQWQLPLVFVILLTFAAGALLGVTATLASLVRQRREISRLRRQLELAERNKVASETALTAGEAQLPMP